MKLIAIFISCLVAISQGQDHVSIELYYESLCPYSQEFIHLNLYPAYQKFGKYMSLYFNPFGNAGYSSNGNGGWKFDCQHGPNECKGNLYQACLLNALQGQEELQLEVLNCIMSDYQPHLATKKCMEELMINNPSYQEIDQCHSGLEGQTLLHDFGVITENLEPSHMWVPWITFNNEWTEYGNNIALEDLDTYLCTEFLFDVPECQ